MWCLEGEECVARKCKDRDESRWVLQKWEEEVEVGKIFASHAIPCQNYPLLPVCFASPLPKPGW